jgi:hypothetical protein
MILFHCVCQVVIGRLSAITAVVDDYQVEIGVLEENQRAVCLPLSSSNVQRDKFDAIDDCCGANRMRNQVGKIKKSAYVWKRRQPARAEKRDA